MSFSRALTLGILLAACGGDDDDDDDSSGQDAGVEGGGPHDPTPDEADALFAPDRLLEIEIELSPADWDVLRHEHHDATTFYEGACDDGYPESPYTTFPATITIDGDTIENVGVRKKGFLGSVTPSRPSLKISFDEYEPEQEYQGLERLTLNNNRQDASQANTCLAYRVFREAGVPAPRCNHARVTVNGQYLGTYSNVESIRRRMVGRWFDDASGNLYEGALADFRPVWIGDYEPKDGNSDDRSDLQALADAAAADDAGLEAALEGELDLDAFLTFWAVEVLVNHWDGYTGNTNNHYVYRDPGNDRFYFLPWGPDASFGPNNPFLSFETPPSVLATTQIPARLYALPAMRERYQARLLELLDRAWDEDALIAEVDRLEEMLGPHVVVTPEAFAADLDRIRAFVRGRRQAIEDDVDASPDWPGGLRDSPCPRLVGTATGTFESAYGPFPAPNPFTAGEGTLELTIDGVTEEFREYGVSAGPFGIDADPQMAVGVVGLRDDFTIGGVVMAMEPALFAAGTELPVDLYTVAAQVIDLAGELVTVRAFGIGTLHLDTVDALDGGTVTGSFDLELFWL